MWAFKIFVISFVIVSSASFPAETFNIIGENLKLSFEKPFTDPSINYKTKEITLLEGVEFFENTTDYKLLQRKLYGKIKSPRELSCDIHELECKDLFINFSGGQSIGYLRIQTRAPGTFKMVARGLGQENERTEVEWTVYSLLTIKVARGSFFTEHLPFFDDLEIESVQESDTVGVSKMNGKNYIYGFASDKLENDSILNIRTSKENFKIRFLVVSTKIENDLSFVQLTVRKDLSALAEKARFAECIATKADMKFAEFLHVRFYIPENSPKMSTFEAFLSKEISCRTYEDFSTELDATEICGVPLHAQRLRVHKCSKKTSSGNPIHGFVFQKSAEDIPELTTPILEISESPATTQRPQTSSYLRASLGITQWIIDHYVYVAIVLFIIALFLGYANGKRM